MSEFFEELDRIFSDDGDGLEIRAVVRNLWFYDFVGHPFRVWDGQGLLVTNDGTEWLGSVTPEGQNVHETPAIKDGRDGSSITKEMSITVPNEGFFRAIKADADLARERDITVYRALFRVNEGLRPTTPIIFAKRLTIMSTKFSENVEVSDNKLQRIFKISVVAKDLNRGRGNTPNRTYSDRIQQQIAESYNLSPDRACEYVALLADRTYTIQ